MTGLAADISDMDDAPTPETALDYRRRARQLRHRFRADPVALHMSLKSLATETDGNRNPRPKRHLVGVARQVASRVVEAKPATAKQQAEAAEAVRAETVAAAKLVATPTPTFDPSVCATLNASPETVEAFATQVRSMLGEGILRFDQRKALFAKANQVGLGRFEASLVIAAVEHRHGQYGAGSKTLPPVRKRSVASLVGIVLLIEAGVAAVAWWVL